MKRKERKRLNKLAKAKLSCLRDTTWVRNYYDFARCASEMERNCDTKPEDLVGYPMHYWYNIKWK